MPTLFAIFCTLTIVGSALVSVGVSLVMAKRERERLRQAALKSLRMMTAETKNMPKVVVELKRSSGVRPSPIDGGDAA